MDAMNSGGGGGARSPRPTASAAMAVPGRSSTTDAAVAADAAAAVAAAGGGGAGAGSGGCDRRSPGLDGAADGDAADLCGGGRGVGGGGGGGRVVGGSANLASSLMLSHVSSHVVAPPAGGAAAGGTAATPRRPPTADVLADAANALGSVAPRGGTASAGGGSSSSSSSVVTATAVMAAAAAALPTLEGSPLDALERPTTPPPRLRRFVSHSYGEAGAHMRRRSDGWGGGCAFGGGDLRAGVLSSLDEAEMSLGGADLPPGVAGSVGTRLSASVGGPGLLRRHTVTGPRQPAAVSWSGGWGTGGVGRRSTTHAAPRVPRRRGRGLSRVNRAVEVRWVPAPAEGAAGTAAVGGTAPLRSPGGGAPSRPAGRWAVEAVARLVPDPPPYGVLVSVAAAAVCDSDLDLLRGGYHPREVCGGCPAAPDDPATDDDDSDAAGGGGGAQGTWRSGGGRRDGTPAYALRHRLGGQPPAAGAPPGRRPPPPWAIPTAAVVPGGELVGRVIAIGTRVTHVAVGDAVAAGGTLPPERTPPPARVAGASAPAGAAAARPPRQRRLGVAVDGGWAAYVLLPDVAVHPVADRLLSPWGVAAGRLAVLSAAVAALPAALAGRAAASHERGGDAEVLVLASTNSVADVPLVALLLGRAGWVPLFHADGGGGAAAVGASLARLPAGAGGLGVISTDGLLSRYAPLAVRQSEGGGGGLAPLTGALDLTGGTSDGLAAAVAVLAPRGVLVLAPSRTGEPSTGTPALPTSSSHPSDTARALPLDAIVAKGLTVVGVPPEAGDYAAGLKAAADLSDTVPVAALGVRQVPLGGAPPVLATAAAGRASGGRLVLVPPPMVASEARAGEAYGGAGRGAPSIVPAAAAGATVDDDDDGEVGWEVDPPPVSPKMSPCASPSFFPPSLAL